MNRLRKIIYGILLVLGLLVLFGTWYNFKYSMDKVLGYTVNDVSARTSLLIATQGSEFKNTLTENVVNEYKQDSIFINVIDISKLDEIKPEDYSAILLIHTWENWKPPMAIKKFIDGNQDNLGKIVVLTTSGEGTNKIDEVDAITGESIKENIESFTNRIIERLNILLSK